MTGGTRGRDGGGSVEERLTAVLGAWACGCVALGAALAVDPRTRGFGRQTAAWGAVDGAIAWAGARRRGVRGPTQPGRLRRVLLVNAALDVGYLLAGLWMLRDGRWRGDGAAVLVQGGFLLGLDTLAARALRGAAACDAGPPGRGGAEHWWTAARRRS